MFVSPYKLQEPIYIQDVVVSVIEIREDIIRLRITAAPDAPPERRWDVVPVGPDGEATDRQYSMEEGRMVMRISRRVGSGVQIGTSQLQVVAATTDSVQVGIRSPATGDGALLASPTGPEWTAPRPLENGPGHDRTQPIPVAPEVFRQWVARQIEAYLANKGRGGLRQLAEKVRVAPSSIARWRSGKWNVVTEHAEALLTALGRSLDDLGRELGLPRVCLPEVKHRGRRQEKAPGYHFPEEPGVETEVATDAVPTVRKTIDVTARRRR